MDSLSDLRNLFLAKEISVDDYNGYQMKVGKDVWTLAHGVFYLNGTPQSLKDKIFLDNYKRKKNVRSQSGQTRKWRGISSRNYRGE